MSTKKKIQTGDMTNYSAGATSAELCLCIGSNFGERGKNVSDAITWLRNQLQQTRCSTIYETPEIHGIGSPYYNAVVIGRLSGDFKEFEKSLKQYEVSAGRDATARLRGDVPIDVDIVMKDSEILRPFDYKQTFFRIGYNQIK